MHSPRAAEPIYALNQVLRKTVVGSKYFELAALVAAREFDQQYEWSSHEPAGLKAGLDQSVIDVVKYNRAIPAGMPEKDAAVIRLSRAIFRDRKVSPELWATMEQLYSEKSLASHTIYRPADLEGRYPVVLWGNGSCVNSSFGYREFLAEIASHGFIVLATGPYRDSPAPRQRRPADPAQWPPFETSYKQMLEALDWITAENGRPGSPFQGKVAVDKVAAMGHSCGGLQAVKVSTDPRITTALVLNSGMLSDGDQYMIRHELERSVLDQMHAPIAYFIGGESDIAYANSEADWKDLQQRKVPALNAQMDVGHGATFSQPNGGAFVTGPLAWLQWQLKGDAKGRAMFVGENCGFCSGAPWRVRRHLLK